MFPVPYFVETIVHYPKIFINYDWNLRKPANIHISEAGTTDFFGIFAEEMT